MITSMSTTFQIVSWDSGDKETDDGLEYQITMYGRTEAGKSVACSCKFEPYFFVEMDHSMRDTSTIDEILQTQMSNLRTDVVDTKLVKRKKFFGFTNDAEFRFCRIRFKSENAMKRAKYIFQPYVKSGVQQRPTFGKKWKIYEANIEPVLRFIHICGIESTGWVSVPNQFVVKEKETFCDEEFSLPDYTHVKRVEKDGICPLIMCSFDIEVYSEDGSFPEPSSSKNYCPVIQIANTYQRYGEKEPYKRDLFTLNHCGPIANAQITECVNEKDLLIKWCKSIQKNDPDVLIGYNIWKFDLHFIMQRAIKVHATTEINLNRLNSEISVAYKAKFSSSAYGDNEYNMVKSIGRMQIDLLELYKREHKLVKYSLDFVSEHFLKDKKMDMPIHELFSRYKRGNVDDMTEIGKYCIKDTELPLRLMQKLNDIPNLMEMAKVTYVPMNFLLERGQQIKVFSQITKATRLENMLVITPKNNAPRPDSFVGATVLNAEKGAYMTEVVVGLDFASLYPTIMRAHNLCYNTIVLDETYGNIEGVTYEETTMGEAENRKTYKFAQNKPGILPRLLENLALSRKKAKKAMAQAEASGDTFMKDVYNGKQLAFKVSMNSVYGFCAAFMLPCQPISACVTTIGRNMIEQTKTSVESWYPGSRVIYGDTDSVMVIFGTQTKDILKESFTLGIEAAERISKTFRYPIELEFEKCYYPYLLFSKKRYAGLMYTKPEASDYIDVKGIQLVRRDNPEFVRTVSKKILDMVMYDRQISEAIEYAMDCGKQLLNNKVPIEQLTVSKSMRQGYKNTNQPHLAVANKMNERSPGSGPRSGDRVPYVFVKTDNQKDLQYQKAEDPVFAKANNVPLDVLYYLKHSLMSPLCSLFELFIDNPKEELFGDMIREREVVEKIICTGYTKAGVKCTNKATEGQETCKKHILLFS